MVQVKGEFEQALKAFHEVEEIVERIDVREEDCSITFPDIQNFDYLIKEIHTFLKRTALIDDESELNSETLLYLEELMLAGGREELR